jgi:hypothetical protein
MNNQSDNESAATLSEEDIYFLIGAAHGPYLAVWTRLPATLLKLAGKMAEHVGNPGLARRCNELRLALEFEPVTLDSEKHDPLNQTPQATLESLLTWLPRAIIYGGEVRIDGVYHCHTSDPLVPLSAVRKTFEALEAQRTPVDPELEEARVGTLNYRGNTVSYMYDRARCYNDTLSEVWSVLTRHGFPVDGNSSVVDAVDAALTALKVMK